jgi:hypothetical protein
MRLQDIIPATGLPRTGYLENTSHAWFGQDSQHSYRHNGGHPLYGESDIEYRLNELGYRSGSFAADADMRIVAVDCSSVFGVGVPESSIFHQLFAERVRTAIGVSVTICDLGVPGTSNDAIVRLHLAVRVLHSDIVLTLFTHLGRREYLTVHNLYVYYAPTVTARDLVAREIAGHFDALSSTYDDRLNLFRNYKSAEALLAGRQWCFLLVKSDDASVA